MIFNNNNNEEYRDEQNNLSVSANSNGPFGCWSLGCFPFFPGCLCRSEEVVDVAGITITHINAIP